MDDLGDAASGATEAADRRVVMRQSVSVGLATSAYAVSFGALSVASGLSILQTMCLSLLLFSGGSQFALVGILAAGGSGIAAAATSTTLGVRNGLHALQVASILRVAPRAAARVPAQRPPWCCSLWAPFLVVMVLAAATAALLRLIGWLA